MVTVSDDIRATVAGMPDAELLAMAAVDCGRHPTPTLIAACQELARRGLAVPPQAFPWHTEELAAERARRDALAPGPQYGGFWRRFGAMWLDVLFVLPVVVVGQWLAAQTKYAQAWMILPNLGVGLVYNVYLVRRFSGTPGKVFLNLRICRLDGTRIGYREAFLRHSVGLVLANLTGVAWAIAAVHVPDGEYATLTYMTRTKRLIVGAPAWYPTVSVLSQLWSWSEFIVMMINRKRRALHDFIAGTVVLDETRPPADLVPAERRPVPDV
jgi:uncharacterized RDD family membrane protein YckC